MEDSKSIQATAKGQGLELSGLNQPGKGLVRVPGPWCARDRQRVIGLAQTTIKYMYVFINWLNETTRQRRSITRQRKSLIQYVLCIITKFSFICRLTCCHCYIPSHGLSSQTVWLAYLLASDYPVLWEMDKMLLYVIGLKQLDNFKDNLKALHNIIS